MTPEIRDYVQHKPDCSEGNLVLGYPTGEMKWTASCSCGLDEALRRVEEMEARKPQPELDGRRMPEPLTPWEVFLLTMPIEDWLELNPCACEALCECEDA